MNISSLSIQSGNVVATGVMEPGQEASMDSISARAALESGLFAAEDSIGVECDNFLEEFNSY